MANVKAKKRAFNLIMVVAAIVIVIGGVMAVNNFKGGSSSDTASGYEMPALTTTEKSGNANIVRAGLGYALDNDDLLQPGDQLETLTKSSIALTQDGVTGLRMGARSTVVLGDEGGKYTASLKGGTALAWAKMPLGLLLCDNSVAATPSDGALLLLSQEDGSATVTVLNGSVSLSGVNAKADAGSAISLLKKDGAWAATVGEFSENSLSDDSIAAAKSFIAAGAACVLSADELTKIADDRAAQRAAAQQQAVNPGYSSVSSTGGNSGTKQPTCTIEIRCDTILNNMADLTPGKEGNVPANGTILATSTVAFNEGDTVFEVLVAACRAAEIQMEYTFSALYGSNYIEGINNLYEFDCGEESGWMYKVNGWFPNYGCSKYELSDGDVIVWCYTCKGLGADVGGGMQ